MKRLLLLLLLVTASFAQNGVRFDNYAFTTATSGGTPSLIKAVPGASIRVCTAAGSPCSPLAALYTDQSLTTIASNPLTADSRGNFGAWVSPGNYVFYISGSGITTSGPYYITLSSNPAIYANAYPGANGGARIQAAIDAAYAAGGGEVLLDSSSVYITSTQIKLKTGVKLRCTGVNQYTLTPVAPCMIQPIVAFSPSSVVLLDPNNVGGGTQLRGVALDGIGVDMLNVKDDGKIAFEFRSVSNSGPFIGLTVLNQDSGKYLYIGRSSIGSASPSDGLTFYDTYTLSNGIDVANTDPCVVIEDSNEISFYGARTKFTRRSNGSPAAGSVMVLVRSTATGGIRAVTFDGVAFAGIETGLRIDQANAAGQVRWVRVLNSTFEGYNRGIFLTGVNSGNKTQFNFIGPGNRFATAVGGSPSNISLDYAANNTIIQDELAPSGKTVIASANATSNTFWAAPAGITDSGSDNLTFGRGGSTGRLGIGPVGAGVGSGIDLGGDVFLDRISAGGMSLRGVNTPLFRFLTGNATDGDTLDILVSGEANQKFILNKSGKFEWGAGGASAVDTNLYRASASVLQTDGAFTATTLTSSIATGTAPLTVSSTTPVANLTTVPATYNISGTQQTGAHIVIGTCILGTSCSVTLTGAAVFSSISSYQCGATDVTSAAAIKFAPASGSSFALTGTATDTLSFVCVGN